MLSIAVTAAADLSQVSEERLALAEQLVRLGEHERHRLALALHDDPVQRLTAALYELSLLGPQCLRIDFQPCSTPNRSSATRSRRSVS